MVRFDFILDADLNVWLMEVTDNLLQSYNSNKGLYTLEDVSKALSFLMNVIRLLITI